LSSSIVLIPGILVGYLFQSWQWGLVVGGLIFVSLLCPLNIQPAVIIAFGAALAAWHSASLSEEIALRTKLSQQIQLRPYVIINPIKNILPYNSPSYVVLPYQLENKGIAPALNIHKSYKVLLSTRQGMKN